MRESMVLSSLLRHRKSLSWMFARNLIFVERLGYVSLALWRTCPDSSVLIVRYSSLLLFSPSPLFFFALSFLLLSLWYADFQGESTIFAATTGGARSLAKEFHVPFLGAVPLDPRIAKCCDFGESFVEEFPDSPSTKAFLSIVKGTSILSSY